MRNRTMSPLVLAFFGLCGYLAYRNRFQIRQFLESRGVNVPIDTSNIGNTIRSTVSKVSGSTEHGVRKTDESLKRVG